MSDLLSVVGLVVGILGVAITVSIFCIQNHQSKKERKIQEMLNILIELSKCEMKCNELGRYEWYTEMIFSQTKKELNHAINSLQEMIRSFKNEKYVYIYRYDPEVAKYINGYIESLEIEIRELIEVEDLQNAFIEHHCGMGNPHDDSFLDEYDFLCDVIKNTLGAFRAFATRMKEDKIHIEELLEKMNYKTNVIDIDFGGVDEKKIQIEIDKSKEQYGKCD